MADELTTNYDFVKPDGASPMNDFETYLNDNWDLIADRVSPPQVTGALPQAGSYKLYDRVYRTDDQSSYILIIKDTRWGWHWRPVQAAMSPWVSLVGKDIYDNVAWNASATLAIAFDNKGQIHWRGSLVRTSPMIANTTENVFRTLPKGMWPTRSADFSLDVATANVAGATGLLMVQYARFFIGGNDRDLPFTPGDSTVRLWGGNVAGTQPSTVYFNIHYPVGAGIYGNF